MGGVVESRLGRRRMRWTKIEDLVEIMYLLVSKGGIRSRVFLGLIYFYGFVK